MNLFTFQVGKKSLTFIVFLHIFVMSFGCMECDCVFVLIEFTLVENG